MKQPLMGRCACKETAFDVHAEPTTVVACHCLFCQRYSGSAFNLVMFVPQGGAKITAGAPQTWHHKTEGGLSIDRVFCSGCGSSLLAQFHAFSLIGIRVGALDDGRMIRPVAHFWTKTMHPWVKIPDGDLSYEEFPPEFESLARLWKERGTPIR